ncbi:MAG: CotH kinase family protein [Oscillospiraceae bacterium]
MDVEQVIRYFVVHNFLCNGDSYTGSMVHNYYLYEEDGHLAMIPWDYNLALGTFQGGNAKEQVNFPIDTPVSGGMDDRPMAAWIFADEEYTALYHQLFAEFIEQTDFPALISETAQLIAEYVEKDPTKFCTYDEFQAGVSAITQFCALRAQSVSGQLDGSIPSTSDGQSAYSSSLVDTGSLNLTNTGSMNTGGGNRSFNKSSTEAMMSSGSSTETTSQQNSMNNVPPMNGDGQMPEMPQNDGRQPPELPQNGDGQPPEMPQNGDGQFPEMPQNSNGQTAVSTEATATAEAAPSQEAPAQPTETGSRPSGGQNGGFTMPENAPGDIQDNAPQMNPDIKQAPGDSPLLLLGISAAVLAAGLIFAFLFRR